MKVKNLAYLFWFILFCMIAVTSWASLRLNLWTHLPFLLQDPWAVATLFDAYFGFITFYVWVCYKERIFWVKIFWFILIMLLGNIAMAVYMLLLIYRLPQNASYKDLFLRHD